MNFHIRNHKKRLLSAVLCGAMMLTAGLSAAAFDSQTVVSSLFANSAEADLSHSGASLKNLGLVSGNQHGDLMLDKAGTRAEALTLFLALLGERDEAAAASYSYTFRDIDAWFSKFAGYGVYRRYTSGYSPMQFGSYDAVTAQQYATFLLRALGYGNGDFVWSKALDKTVEIGLCTQQQADRGQNKPFRRQEIMEMSYLALSTKLKNSASTLADKLIADGTITAQAAKAEKLTYGTAYHPVREAVSKKTIAHDAMPAGNYELHNAATGRVMTAYPISRQADICTTVDQNAATQLFRIISGRDGTFRIVSASNHALGVDVNPTSGADAILWTANGTDCQNYIATLTAPNTYAIRLASNPDMALTEQRSDVRLCAYTGAAAQQWKLSDNSENTAAASAKLQSVMKIHPNGKRLGGGYSFAGASQCMGFGREVFYRMYGTKARWSYDGSPKSASDGKLFQVTARSSSYSANSMRALIQKAKPGDILQMNTSKMHTMVFVSSDSTGFTVYDANWTGPNKVSVRHVNYGAWSGRNSRGICVIHSTNYPKS